MKFYTGLFLIKAIAVLANPVAVPDDECTEISTAAASSLLPDSKTVVTSVITQTITRPAAPGVTVRYDENNEVIYTSYASTSWCSCEVGTCKTIIIIKEPCDCTLDKTTTPQSLLPTFTSVTEDCTEVQPTVITTCVETTVAPIQTATTTTTTAAAVAPVQPTTTVAPVQPTATTTTPSLLPTYHTTTATVVPTTKPVAPTFTGQAVRVAEDSKSSMFLGLSGLLALALF